VRPGTGRWLLCSCRCPDSRPGASGRVLGHDTAMQLQQRPGDEVNVVPMQRRADDRWYRVSGTPKAP